MKNIKCDLRPPDSAAWNAKTMVELAPGFGRIFNASLQRFMHPYYGFNIVAFDDWIGPVDGRSCLDIVTEQYGQNGLDLISRLLSGPPTPEPVETWTDVEFDIDAAASTTGFAKCQFHFIAVNGKPLTGEGFYKNGVIVHRDFVFLNDEYLQMGPAVWIISTSQGVRLGSESAFADAKKLASQFARCLDFEGAQTMALTNGQRIAANRVYNFLKGGNHGMD